MGDAQHNTMTGGAIEWLLRKIKRNGLKPEYNEDETGDWHRHYIRIPDTGIIIQWMRWRSAESVATASGSGYQSSRTVNLGDWKIPFKQLQASFAWVQGPAGSNVWLSTANPQTESSGGTYYIKSHAAVSTQKSYWVYVVAIGTYERS